MNYMYLYVSSILTNMFFFPNDPSHFEGICSRCSSQLYSNSQQNTEKTYCQSLRKVPSLFDNDSTVFSLGFKTKSQPSLFDDLKR